MLKILVESQEIDFDGVITLRLLNPMFNDKISHSYNCKTTLTARNKDVFNQLHLPEIGYSQVRFNGMLVTDSFTLRGAIYVNSITDKHLDFQFNAQNDFWNLINTSFDNVNIPSDNVRYLPVNNSKHMDAFNLAGDAYSEFMNGVNLSGIPLNDNTTASVPFFKLNDVVRGIFNHFNVTIGKNDLASHADIDQLYIFNVNSDGDYTFNGHPIAVSIAITNGQYVITTVNNALHGLAENAYVQFRSQQISPVTVYNQINEKVFRISVNDPYSITLLDITPVASSITFARNSVIMKPVYNGHAVRKASDHLPGSGCSEFLKELEKLLAFRVFPDESTNTAYLLFLKDIINSQDVVDISGIAGEESGQDIDKLDGFKLSYEDPSDDERWSERITPLTDILTVKDPVATFSALPITGSIDNDVRLVNDENCYYRFSNVLFTKISGWEFYSENVLPMQVGSGKLSIETKFSPVLTKKASDLIRANVEKEGKFVILNQRVNDDFRLFFYRGDLQYFFSNPLPLLTNDVYYADGTKIATANLSLRWDGQYGLYEQLYREYIDLMTNKYRESTRYVKWPEWMLNSFAWWKKYRVNHQNYLVKSIDIELTADENKIKDSVLVPV